MNDLRLSLIALVLLAPSAAVQATEKVTCPRTTGSLTIPGSMFPSAGNWFGSNALAVLTSDDGSWFGLGPKYDYREKLWWYSAAFEPGMESQMTVTGRRLDVDSLPARVTRTTNAQGMGGGGWAMLMLVEFPSAGCWELTGEFQGQRLTFVVETRDPAPVPAARPAS